MPPNNLLKGDCIQISRTWEIKAANGANHKTGKFPQILWMGPGSWKSLKVNEGDEGNPRKREEPTLINMKMEEGAMSQASFGNF